MGRIANDGRGRLGGRTAGTPNKCVSMPEWIEKTINQNRRRIETALQGNSEGSAILMAALVIVNAMNKNSQISEL